MKEVALKLEGILASMVQKHPWLQSTSHEKETEYLLREPMEDYGYTDNANTGSSTFDSMSNNNDYVISNASLDTPLPKAQRLEHGFRDFLNLYGDKNDLSKLPHINSTEYEYQMSSVFVDGVSAKNCRDVMVHEAPLHWL